MKQYLKQSLLFASTLFSAQASFALTFERPANDDVVGHIKVIHAEYEDTFALYARRYDVGYYEMLHANPGVDDWIPGEGTPITIPTEYILPRQVRDGIVINLPEYRLYYFHDGKVDTYPLGIGRAGWATPLATTKIIGKEKDPYWYVPKSILAEHEANDDPIEPIWPPGPENPLGKYKLILSLPGILIHGTNYPIGVGRRVTHACMRLFPEDIETLFNTAPVGTAVHIIDEPIKAGWRGDHLYLEVHPILEEHPQTPQELRIHLVNVIERATQRQRVDIDWNVVKRLVEEANGVPEPVGRR